MIYVLWYQKYDDVQIVGVFGDVDHARDAALVRAKTDPHFVGPMAWVPDRLDPQTQRSVQDGFRITEQWLIV